MILSLQDIFVFVKCTINSRNLVEGECVLNSNQIILCGKIITENSACIAIKCLVLKTSQLSDMPHEVNGQLKILCNGVNELAKKLDIGYFACSCPAGASECCKHVVAVLLYLNRTHIEDISCLSSTDVACQWSKLKQPSLEQYKPVPLEDFCCIKIKQNNQAPSLEVNGPLILAELLSAAGDSALQFHIKGRNLKRSLIINEPETNYVVEKLNLLKPHCVLEIIYNYGVINLGDCCQKTWSKLSQYEPDYIRIRSKTDKHFWDDVRQYRITGSRCYSLYTYNMKPRTEEEWNLKASKYFWPVQVSNKFVHHEIKYENTARILYEKETGIQIFQCGCITWPNEPWLSYSPDGLIINEFNVPIKLIEIKCPFKYEFPRAY